MRGIATSIPPRSQLFFRMDGCDKHFQQRGVRQQDCLYFILDSGCDSVTDTETEDEKNPADSHRLTMSEEHGSSRSTGDCPVVQPSRIQCGVLYVHSLGYVPTVSCCSPLCCFVMFSFTSLQISPEFFCHLPAQPPVLHVSCFMGLAA